MQKMSEQELQELASQLSHPKGENGITTAKSMNFTNDNMIRKTIGCMEFRDDQQILEIGPGNGSHLSYLFEKNNSINYTGIDISELMIREAKALNQQWINSGHAAFELTNGESIEKPDAVYDVVFTVNTLYFWKNPTAFLKEIYRILKNNSSFVMAFIPKNTMEKIPFTKYGFELYHNDDVCDLLQKTDFVIDGVFSFDEEVQSNSGATVKRTFTIIKAFKH